jgi:hypothetical protein
MNWNRVDIRHGPAKTRNLKRRRSVEIPDFSVELLQNLVIWSASAEHLVVDHTHTLGRKPVLPQLDSRHQSQHMTTSIGVRSISQVISSSPLSSFVDS